MHGRRKGKPRFSGASPGDASVLIFLAKQHAKYCAVKRICGEKPPAQCHRGIKDCGLNPLCNIPCNKAVAAKPVMGHVHIHVPSRQTVENCAVSKRGGFGYRKVQRLSGLTFHRHRIQRQSHGRIQTTRRHPVAHQEDRFAVHLRLRGLGSGCLCGYIFNIWKNIPMPCARPIHMPILRRQRAGQACPAYKYQKTGRYRILYRPVCRWSG